MCNHNDIHEPSHHIQAKRHHRDILNELSLMTSFKEIPNHHTIVNTWVQPQFFVRFVLLNLQFSLYYFVDHCSFSFCHFIVCPSIYCFWWWPLLYLLIMTPLVSSDDEFLGIFWWWAPWYLLMITPLVSSDDDLLGIFWWWPPRYLLMMTPLVSSDDDPLGTNWST